tara:strand:- start:13069 stop:16263 length:3195 start_codon:yes stop_codon:yes gene_type:complete
MSVGNDKGIVALVLRQPLAYPWLTILLSLCIALAAARFLPQLQTDLNSDAFLAPDNPALVYRDLVRERFGLSDPLVVAVVGEHDNAVYRTDVLQLIQQLSDKLSGLPNINDSRVVSIATENNIVSSPDGMEVKPFLDPMPDTPDALSKLKRALDQFPLYQGVLVSRDGRAALIVAELLDEDQAQASYQAVMQVVGDTAPPEGITLHVAGEGAVMGYLVSYVDADAKRLVPLTGVVILAIIFLVFRQFSPVIMCAVIIACTLVVTVGAMAGQGVPFYVITNAMPVILVGISVADAIHIYSHYFDLQREHPQRDRRELLSETVNTMFRPITLTTLTTMAGFLGLYFAAYMPPFKYFGLYAALGVAVAWFYSLFFLPAAMALTLPAARPRSANAFATRVSVLAQLPLRYPRGVISIFVLMVLVGSFAASRLQVDDDPIGLFLPDEPVAVADRAINEHMQGSNTLDIVIETPEVEGLFDPARLRQIEALQSYLATLPYVGGSVSIVDYLKQMNRALSDGGQEAYVLPDDPDLIAQYFLIYSVMSDPTDFEEEVDYDYQTANIRVFTKSGGYQEARQIIEPLQAYIDEHFATTQMSATLSGRVNLNYRWIKELAHSHFSGLAIALVLVWAVSALLFRSEKAGVYTLIPVLCAVLGVYAVMVIMNISLGMGTSMFAAIAVGLGIDFAIHTLDRLRSLCGRHSGDVQAAIIEYYTTTGKALMFNFLAIACGFGVLTASKIVSLNSFGSIVMLAIATSFIASVTLLPAMVAVLRPQFVVAATAPTSAADRFRLPLVVLGVLVLAAVLLAQTASAAEEGTATVDTEDSAKTLTAGEIVDRVIAVDDGEQVTRKLTMTLIDRRGKERLRETVIYRKYYGEETRTVVFYLAPSNLRDTGFLIWDYPESDKEDDQWLYLPAMRKVRRISAADRGDYFLGTDFTYEDIKLDGKLEPADYDFSLLTIEVNNDQNFYRLEGKPKNPDIAQELGYSKMEVVVDGSNWMVTEAEFWDLKGNPLKQLVVSDITRVDGVWTRGDLMVVNHQTGHQTHFVFTEVDYKTPVNDSLFSKRALERGH